VVIPAIKNNHAHAASQIAAVAQIFAAVVNHFVFNPIFIIAQAPKNHTQDTT
jgi:hypothetical protein